MKKGLVVFIILGWLQMLIRMGFNWFTFSLRVCGIYIYDWDFLNWFGVLVFVCLLKTVCRLGGYIILVTLLGLVVFFGLVGRFVFLIGVFFDFGLTCLFLGVYALLF